MSEQVIKNNYIRGVTLTGSEKAGSTVASLAGASIKKSILELGGSDPFIVLDDADIKRASLVATSARLSVSGQVCISAKRFIIQKKIANEFILELTKDFDPIVRDSSLRSINRLKFAIPRNVKDEVDNLLKLHKSNLD